MSKRKGFTFIEVALFLVITAMIFLGVAMGMQNSIFQQRYNDATQSFFEFMRSIYSKVSNPQSSGHGYSEEYAIYGKLIVFGQRTDMFGETIPANESLPIYTYDVIGNVVNIKTLGSGDAKTLLKNLNVNVARVVRKDPNDRGKAELVSPEKYEMRWQMSLQNEAGQEFQGSVLVVRHPRSGTINTFVLKNEVIQVNKEVSDFNKGSINEIDGLLKNRLDSFSNGVESQLDFCVSPYDAGASGPILRRDIRVLPNARNASSVQLIDQDGDDNQCK